MVKGLWQQTLREKQAHLAGLGLFFGALLGANLGTISELPLRDYAFLVILLAGAVSTLHISLASERRGYVAALILLYVGLMILVYLRPSLRPSMSEEDFLKLLSTLGIWLGAVAMVHFQPTLDPPAVTSASDDASA